MEKKFETIRHGHKEGEELSNLGWDQSREKAKEIFQSIKESPNSTIFYAISSNIGRAIDTKEAIESKLKELSEGDKHIEVISVYDLNKINQIKSNKDKKYIITDFAPSILLGYDSNPEVPVQKTFLKLREMFDGDEDLVAEVLTAREGEISEIRSRIKNKFPEVDTSTLHPKKFELTPEEQAIPYLNFMKRMKKITEKHFPNNSWTTLHVGHNISADYAAMALMGKDISLKTYNELGGQFRDFVESAYFDFHDEKIISEYRGHKTIVAKSLEEITSNLEKISEKRKKEWSESKL